MPRNAPLTSFIVNNWIYGMDWTSAPVDIPYNYLADANNINLHQGKIITKRRGCSCVNGSNQLSGSTSNLITSIQEYVAPNGSTYLLVACNDKMWMNKTGGWAAIKTGLTADQRYSFASTNGYCFVTNGTEMFKVRNETVYDTIGLTGPDTAPTVALSAISYDSVTEDYLTSDNTYYYNLRQTTTYTELAQTFTMADDGIITSIKLFCGKINSPTGNMWLEIWTDGGGSTAGPGTQLGTDSAVVDVSTITGASTTFTFTDMPQLEANTKYWIRIVGDYTINATNYIRVFRGTSTSWYPAGAPYYYNATSWVAGDKDFHFELTYDKPTDVTGRYKWVYAWKTTSGLITNPSPASTIYVVRGQTATVTCKYSTNAEVTKVILYRTLDMGDEDSEVYYEVTEVDNDSDGSPTTVDITDSDTDNDLTELLETNNTAPPVAKFLVVYQDRLIYANCPLETDGGSLFMISKVGSPEAVPSANYNYFDRDDGNDITGIAMLPDYLVVFKKNKIATMTRDFSEWNTISRGVGCIAPWSIITMTDKIVFLSEEGPKCTDGKTVFDLSKKLNKMSACWTESNGAGYTGAYYPSKKQFFFYLYGVATYGNSCSLVGHWLQSLYMDVTPENAQEELYVGWTYHTYDNHNFSAISTYTSSGITKVIAGTTDGYLFDLDHDDLSYDLASNNTTKYDINVNITTGFLPLGTPPGIEKTVRYVNIVYGRDTATGTSDNFPVFYIDTDFTDSSDSWNLDGTLIATTPTPSEGATYFGSANFDMLDTSTGKYFRFRFVGGGEAAFSLISIQPFFRIEGGGER